jgi:DNA-binding transcriptional LysR family regulator
MSGASHLLSVCANAGFNPRIGYTSGDTLVMQALVAGGLGVATQSGLGMRAHHIDGVVATELPNSALTAAATSAVTSSGQVLARTASSLSLRGRATAAEVASARSDRGRGPRC